jgi:molybdopterin-containing oxidoreductase family iron-sulfur binding subunit
MAACPYGARSFNWKDPQPLVAEKTPGYPTRTKGVVEKCNFCADTVPKGQIPVPHCVAACKKDKGEGEEALFFGDLGAPNSRVRELLSSRYAIRRRPGLGTQPNVYYLV